MKTSNSTRLMVLAFGLAAASVIFVQWKPSGGSVTAPVVPAVAEVEKASGASGAVADLDGGAPAQVEPVAPVQRTVSKGVGAPPQASSVAERKLEDIPSGEYAVNLAEDDTELAYQLGQDLGSMSADEVTRWKQLRAQHLHDSSEAVLGQ